jgi:biotin-dependent carboxylase-like uncharacterized protein
MIDIITAPPFATIQDLGRFGHRASGVPVSGAMDPEALRLANSLVGNPPEAAAIEWALGGGAVIFRRPLRYALAGALRAPRAAAANAGDTLAVMPPLNGRFFYIAVEGGIDVPQVLGSRSTYLPGAFGGFDGRILRAGDRLPVGASRAKSPLPPVPGPYPLTNDPIRLIFGPHRSAFTPEHREQFLATEFTIAQASDRTGYRLDGAPLAAGDFGTRLSEPVCPGAIQITTSGQPIVLMPDAPTVGGYPVIGVVHSEDLGRFAQHRPGETVRFREI